MIAARAATAALLAAGAIALAGCGGDDEPARETTRAEGAATGPGPVEPGPVKPQPPTGDGRGGVALERVGDFEAPVFVTSPPGERRIYVVEQGGTIRIRGREEPFLDIRSEVKAGGEQGLLSVAFAPDYRESGLLYVNYTDGSGDTRVVEYRRDGEALRADPGSAREVLFQEQPFENHNGGLMVFGADGLLYIGLGDGGSAGDPERNGQDLSTLLGKILRIDPSGQGDGDYAVPDDNPFAEREGARPEIFAYGLRNPWRFSFDRRGGDLVIGDVGQDSFEEVDYVEAGDAAGANFGWSAFEGFRRFNSDQRAPGHVQPVLTYGRERGCSVTGGYVVRDRKLRSLYGRYLYADYCAGELRSFVPAASGARDDRALGITAPAVSSFGEDGAGRVYVVSLEGPVHRLVPASE